MYQNMKKSLSFLIKPTSFDCNLFCDYCFYQRTKKIYPKTSIHRMNENTCATLFRKAQEYCD